MKSRSLSQSVAAEKLAAGKDEEIHAIKDENTEKPVDISVLIYQKHLLETEVNSV